MTNINIFLISSEEELHEDRLEIIDFFQQLNNRCVERGLFFKITTCTASGCIPNERQQEGIDQKICDSDLFVILLRNKAGKYSIEKFDVAYEHFKSTGTPAILTFFRTDGAEPDDEVKAFMDRLNQDLGHYFKTYSDINTLKLYLLMQVSSMNLDSGIEFRDEQAYIAGNPILAIDHLPELEKNVELQKAREATDIAEQEYLEAMARYVEDDNEDNYRTLENAKEKRDNCRKQEELLEHSILDLTRLGILNCGKGNLSPRQKQAIQLMEKGDFQDAYECFDLDEINAENADFDLTNVGNELDKLKNKMNQCISELLCQIEIMKTFEEGPDVSDEIEKLYETAVKIEMDRDLEGRATREFIKYLEEQGEYSKGIQLARQYLERKRKTGDNLAIRDGEVCLASLLRHQKDSIESLKEAEDLYREILKIDRDLAAEHPELRREEIASDCTDLAGIICDDSERQDEAEVLYREALEIQRSLAADDQKMHEADLAASCNNLAEFLRNQTDAENQKEAEVLFREAVKIEKELQDKRENEE